MLRQSLFPSALGAALSLYLYFLLPGTSVFFFELYHFSKVEFIYWVYSGFKVASVFYPRWDYFELSAIAAGLLLTLLIYSWQQRKAQPIILVDTATGAER